LLNEQLGQYDLAARSYRKAAGLNPKSPAAYMGLGRALTAAGDHRGDPRPVRQAGPHCAIFIAGRAGSCARVGETVYILVNSVRRAKTVSARRKWITGGWASSERTRRFDAPMGRAR